MNFVQDNLYHVYNQGNNKQSIFSCDEDYFIFLKSIRKHISPNAELIAYCLMPNHFHFLLYVDERINVEIKQGSLIVDPLTNGIRKLLSGHARVYNQRYNRTGSLFRQKTKVKCLSNVELITKNINAIDYQSKCFHYIHQNPLKAGFVEKIEDWEYSSYKDYAGLRSGTLCNKILAEKYCSYDTRTFVKRSVSEVEDTLFLKLL
jgi:putative transposase